MCEFSQVAIKRKSIKARRCLDADCVTPRARLQHTPSCHIHYVITGFEVLLVQ